VIGRVARLGGFVASIVTGALGLNQTIGVSRDTINRTPKLEAPSHAVSAYCGTRRGMARWKRAVRDTSANTGSGMRLHDALEKTCAAASRTTSAAFEVADAAACARAPACLRFRCAEHACPQPNAQASATRWTSIGSPRSPAASSERSRTPTLGRRSTQTS
jgi:hypothetical protein